MRNFSNGGGRSAVRAQRGMISTSHAVASGVGLKLLHEGGNAVDAAIGAAAVLNIAEPHMTGIGGDCFAMIGSLDKGVLTAMNGSGRTPQAAKSEPIEPDEEGRVPRHSVNAITIPGAVDGWWNLHERFGKLDWDKVLEPACNYAEEGIVVHDRVAHDWEVHKDNVSSDSDAKTQYLKAGKPYQVGEVFSHAPLAKAMKLIQRQGRDAFYQGEITEDMLIKLNALGGAHSESDFASVEAEFITPISADYHGYRVWECPPNGQGITALILLKLLERFDLAKMNEVDRIHIFAELTKLAYHLRDTYVADPLHSEVPTDWLLADKQIDSLTSMVNPKRAQHYAEGDFPSHNDTVYLAAVDEEGLAVSFINSLFDSFGSGISTPQYGVLFQSRGRGFSLNPNHPNAFAGGKRPLHTLIPGMLTEGDNLIGPFGVMGADYQAAGHAMLISNFITHGMDPQEALTAPRFFAHKGILQLEASISSEISNALKKCGHVLDYPSPEPIGGGQAIFYDRAQGIWVAGSDPRKDGLAIGY